MAEFVPVVYYGASLNSTCTISTGMSSHHQRCYFIMSEPEHVFKQQKRRHARDSGLQKLCRFLANALSVVLMPLLLPPGRGRAARALSVKHTPPAI